MDQLGKYTVIRRLGIGGMAEVFLCRLVGIGGFEKQVVLKRIRADIEADPEFMMMFFDEARVAANLSHPNIIQVFEVDQLGGTPYLAMEYVRGATLSRVLQKLRATRATMDLGHFAFLFSSVCAGLDHAHNARDAQGQPLSIVHRDISPQNIIVSFDGTPKIFDFGVAKARGSMNQTGADRVKGKFAYMAPEQLRARPVDAKADVYAVGVCMYEAVTGRRPFAGGTEGELLAARLEGRFTMPSEYLPAIPVELEHLILSAMAPDPADRPSALELHQALASFCSVGSEHPSNALAIAAWLRETFAEEIVEAYESYPSVGPSATSLPRSANLPPTSSAVEARLRKPWRVSAVLGAVALGGAVAMAVVVAGMREERPQPAASQATAPAAAAPANQARELRAVAQAQQELEEKHRRELQQIRQELQEAKRDDAPAAAARATSEYTVEERKMDRTAPLKKKPAPAPVRIATASKGAGSASMAVGRGSAGSGSSAPMGGSSNGSNGSGSSGGSGSAYVAAQVGSASAGSAHAPAANGSAAITTAKPPSAPRPAPVAVINPGSLDATPSFAKLAVDGSLTTTEVQSALGRTAEALRSCYRAAAKKANQTPDVSIRVSFEIDEGARASGVRVTGDVLGLGACAKETLGSVRTRVAPDVGTVSVSAVIRFKPVR